MYIMNTYDVWFTREGPVGSGEHRCLHVLESGRDQALEALRGERVRAVNVEFLAPTGKDRSVVFEACSHPCHTPTVGGVKTL